MKKCKCEHWQTCPVCYPQGFDEAGNRKPVEIPPTRDEMLARIKELEAELSAFKSMSACEACATIPAVMEYVKQLEAERDALQKTVDEYRESFPRVQSQRNAFERRIDDLWYERDALAMIVQQLHEYLWNALESGDDGDWQSARNYINEARTLPNNTEAIIKRHDAAVLRKAADDWSKSSWPDEESFSANDVAQDLLKTAAELEKS